MYIVPKIEVREAEDIADFATTMDSDMNQYFEEKKTLLEDIPRGENPGTAYYSFYPAVINPKLFYAYILAIKYFQDGTCRWKLCLTSREVVYVNTEGIKWNGQPIKYMYRYADDMKDTHGYHNRWATSLEELVNGITELLLFPVSEVKDCRI